MLITCWKNGGGLRPTLALRLQTDLELLEGANSLQMSQDFGHRCTRTNTDENFRNLC